MPLTTNKELLALARKGGYAVGAFNMNNLGICKINIDTDLRLSFVGALREILTTKPEEFGPRKILGPGREAIKQTVQSKMKLFKSSGKAA